jgi:hypothetical protein
MQMFYKAGDLFGHDQFIRLQVISLLARQERDHDVAPLPRSVKPRRPQPRYARTFLSKSHYNVLRNKTGDRNASTTVEIERRA